MPLTEQDLRETKGRLVEAVVEQQRRGGAGDEVKADALGNQRAAEDFVNPILEKVARDHEVESKRPNGASYPANTSSTKEDAGKWQWDLESDELKPMDEVARKIIAPRAEHPAIAATRERLQFLRTQPEWRFKIETIMRTPMSPRDRERAYRRILAKSVRAFGNPLQK